MAREGNNYGVLLKKIAAMFTFSLSALTHIGRQDGEWELLLKYDHDDVHNFKTCRAEYLCEGPSRTRTRSSFVYVSEATTAVTCVEFGGGKCRWGRPKLRWGLH